MDIGVNNKKNANIRKKKTLGCMSWGLILAISTSIMMILFSDIVRSQRGSSAFFPILDNITTIATWFFILIIPIEIFAIIIGKLSSISKPSAGAAILTFFISSVLSLFFLSFLYSLPLGSPQRPNGESFWNPPIIGITALLLSLFLGVIASYGYWHVGKKSARY